MRNRLPVFIFSLICFSTLRTTAQEGTNSAFQPEPGHAIIVDLAELDTIEHPESIKVLQVLDVSETDGKIDDKALQKLERFPEIRTLVLGCPEMTDKGLKHIAKLKQLECLIIYQCEITDDGIQNLKPLSKLQTVGLHETPVSDAGIAKLKVALPKTYLELGSSGKNGRIFDANGCMRPQFLNHHLTVQQGGAE